MTQIKSWDLKDRVYMLTGNKTPLSAHIQVRHTQRRPLLWFDEEKKVNRPLRYATNQTSLFVDEQDGNATLEHVVFHDGALTVPRNNPLLQQFLSIYHPRAGKLWVEIDHEVEAQDEIEVIETEYQALTLAHELEIDQLEAILRSELGSSVSTMSSKEIKRDSYLFARHNPALFIQLADDEDVKYRSFANAVVEAGLVILTKDNTEFCYKNKRKIFTVPFEENPYSALARWFKTDEGSSVFINLTNRLEGIK